MNKFLTLIFLFFLSNITFAQHQNSPTFIDNDSIMMTVILRHQQTNPVDTIQGKIMKQKFYEKLEASHAKVMSWNVVMGIGQIITLKFKPHYLREINIVFESGAWGGFTTEFYPTYDFMTIYPMMLDKEQTLNKQ